MDRITSIGKNGENVIILNNSTPGIWSIDKSRTSNNTYKLYGFVADSLAAYEDTGLTPEEINHFREVTKMVEDAADEETFIDHLNALCDIKDKRIAELEAGLARLRKLLGEIEVILGGDVK